MTWQNRLSGVVRTKSSSGSSNTIEPTEQENYRLILLGMQKVLKIDERAQRDRLRRLKITVFDVWLALGGPWDTPGLHVPSQGRF